MQRYVLDNTIQYIFHLDRILTRDPDSQCMEQKEISIIVLGNLLYKNKEGVMLMQRIFPKALFKQVVTDKNLCQNYDWSLEEWKEFLQNLSKDYDTAKE